MSTAKQLSPDMIVAAAQRLSRTELSAVIRSLHAVEAQGAPGVLGAQESALIARINNAPPLEVRQRYMQLIAKRQDETLTDSDYAELLDLTDIAEQYQVDRLDALIHLAQIRNLSLEQIMADLNMLPAPVE